GRDRSRPAGRAAGEAGGRFRPGRTGGSAMNPLPAPLFLPVDWWVLGPILALTVGGCLLLLLEFLPAGPRSSRAAIVSLLSLLAAGYAVFRVRDDRRFLFEGMFVHDGLT